MRSYTYRRLVKNPGRIDDKTLIARADIGNQYNTIGFMDHQGNGLGKYPKVYNSRRGFEFLRKNIQQVMEEIDLTKALLGL